VVDNIKERLLILYQDITFGADLSEADCVVINGELAEWGREEQQPSEAELNAVSQDNIDSFLFNIQKRELIIFTKKEAYSRIVNGLSLPEWKQRNYSAEASVLLEKKIDNIITQAELDRLHEIRKIKTDQVDPIRNASDVIESEIESGVVTSEVQIVNNAAWPI
jgi:hypothetical protein